MKVSEILVLGQAMIADKSQWTCGVFGKDKNGVGTGTTHIDVAVAYCAEGSVVRAGLNEEDRWKVAMALRFLNFSSIAIHNRSTISVNDNDALDGSIAGEDERHAAIMKVFDHAIARAKEKEATDAASTNG